LIDEVAGAEKDGILTFTQQEKTKIQKTNAKKSKRKRTQVHVDG